MIENVLIQNYQSHKKTSLDFHEGVSVIVGASDSGKSAILRSLNWSINNKPLGDSFRSNWGGNTSVSIELDNQLIQRVKSKKDNKYNVVWDVEEAMMMSGGGSSQDYKAMGAEVPEEIQSLLNMNDVNLQKQMDMPFLLSASAGETARYLNKMVQLDKIDSALSKIESKKKRIKSDLNHRESDLVEQEKELSGFDWLADAETKVKALEVLNSDFIRIKNKFSDLNTIINNIERIKSEQVAYTEILEYETQVGVCLELDKEIEVLSVDAGNLNYLLTDIADIKERINESNTIVKYESKTNEMLALNTTWITLEQTKIDLSDLLEDIAEQEEAGNKMRAKKEKAEKEYTRLFPEVCPLCQK